MNRSDNNASSRQSCDRPAIESLLLTLESEADSLSPDIMHKLAQARHLAAMHASRQHRSPCSVTDATLLHRQQDVQVQASSPEAGVSRLQHYMNALWQTRPLSASLATGCVASLAAILVVNTAQMLSIDGTGSIPMTNSSTELTIDPVPDDISEPSVKAASFVTPPSTFMPEMTQDESLDLVGSVDFLLWLDSQQG